MNSGSVSFEILTAFGTIEGTWNRRSRVRNNCRRFRDHKNHAYIEAKGFHIVDNI